MMANLSEDIQCVGSDTRPPMLDMSNFESWQQCIRLYCLGKDNGENILKLIDEGPFKIGKFRETLAKGALHLGPKRDTVFIDLAPEKERFKADTRATNILLQGSKLTKMNVNHSYTMNLNTSVRTKEKPFTNTMSVQNDRVVVQNVQGRQNRGQGNYAKENRVVLDEDQLLFIASGQTNTFDDDVDEAPAPTSQTSLQNISSGDPIYDDSGPSYDLDILSEVQDHDNYLDSVGEYHEVHEMQNDVQPNYFGDSDAEYTSDSNIIPYEQERGFEQTKKCYLIEVIPFFKTLKVYFEGIQTALVKEVKEMEEIFEQMKAEVEQNVVDKQCAKIVRKNLLIENANLIADCLSTELLYSVMNDVNNVSRFSKLHDAYTVGQARCLELKVEISKLKHKIEKDDHSEMLKHFSNLEIDHLNLQLKYQNLNEHFGNNKSQTSQDTPEFDSFFKINKMKASLQGKDNTIRKLKEKIS
nr:integrase, catalytic region, zinc finger, CCHC-type, peptidase aspartic, catalytic [Tanacetum cinerariifolium]